MLLTIISSRTISFRRIFFFICRGCSQQIMRLNERRRKEFKLLSELFLVISFILLNFSYFLMSFMLLYIYLFIYLLLHFTRYYWWIDFNGMATHLGLLSTEAFGNCVHCVSICAFFLCCCLKRSSFFLYYYDTKYSYLIQIISIETSKWKYNYQMETQNTSTL